MVLTAAMVRSRLVFTGLFSVYVLAGVRMLVGTRQRCVWWSREGSSGLTWMFESQEVSLAGGHGVSI